MEFEASTSVTSTFTSSSRDSRRSRSSCSTRKRSAWSPFPGITSKGYLVVVVIVVMTLLQFSSPVQSASLRKRSASQSDETCRSNAICGWEVYHPTNGHLQFYVASSCKCSQKELCVRAETDLAISAGVFRCNRKKKTTTTHRPAEELNEAS